MYSIIFVCLIAVMVFTTELSPNSYTDNSISFFVEDIVANTGQCLIVRIICSCMEICEIFENKFFILGNLKCMKCEAPEKN